MKADITREQHLELYYFMKLNRMLEEAMVRLFRQNKIVGGLYSSLGQEAISVGTAYALEKKDWLAPMIRNIGALLVKGFRPRDIFTQHMAKYTSPTLGKDGTSHFGDLEKLHTVSPISMLGDLIPVMTGIGIAGRYLGQNIVALTWIGDGGSSTGVFHEGMDFAAVQKAPLVLVLENNQWAYSTPVRRQVPLENLADRAKAYGIDSYVVDGNDVVAVFTTAREAVARCRAGQGPILIEAKTMRMKGHAQHDPAEYVPKEMFAYWKQRDPIERYEKVLLAERILDARKKAEIEARIEREIETDREFAENSPLPPAELAEQGVYCDGCHTIAANWMRPKEEVVPPKSGVAPVWKVAAYGEAEKAAEFVPAADAAGGNGARPPQKPLVRPAATKKTTGAGKSAVRKARR
ncbi:MAG TPA: thiamine pyrophosphate-dependent dehydrogenase E1 component subunit alpha [Candidatus Acidoferrales bacterium]|nr:thiamine pyrophosphate-dependent dehydrogenase E1 component subunit alpha [Candidatus Acidoferrales bacterium]